MSTTKINLPARSLYTTLRDILHQSVFMGAFFKFSEYFFDQHELLSFTYMIYCVVYALQ